MGGLYETAGRGWVTKPEPNTVDALVRHGEWNQMTVTAIGDDISVSLNGVTVTELRGDLRCLKEGQIALQLHGGMEMNVEFRDIAVLELP